MVRLIIGSLTTVFVLFFGGILLVSQSLFGSFSLQEKLDFKTDLHTKDRSYIVARLEEAAARSEGVGSDSFKLCQEFMNLQSGDEWQGHREVIDEIVRIKLSEMKGSFPEYLSKSKPADAEQLVLMGKLYEQHLYDQENAKQCYTKVVQRLFKSQRVPGNVQDWRDALAQAEVKQGLSAEERYAIKRLRILNEQEQIILGRIAEATDQQILAEELELYSEHGAEPFDPSVALEEFRRLHLEGNGGAQ